MLRNRSRCYCQMVTGETQGIFLINSMRGQEALECMERGGRWVGQELRWSTVKVEGSG